MPYAHLQLEREEVIEKSVLVPWKVEFDTHVVLATKNPKRNGERNGEMMKPIVQMLSLNPDLEV